jgi:acetylornithine deacetylase/succinyl-diaminopimelate desuccinylase-like protein
MIENFNEIKNFLTGEENETISLIKQITVIPAPSTKEFKRAEFIKNKLISYGAKGVYIDDVFNVIYPVNVKNSTNVTAFFAHTDTVFSDETTMPLTDDGEYIYSPGVTDNVVCVAQMLTVCKYIATRGVEDNGNGLLFVFNSCEEGLGNLKGAKKIFEDFGSVTKRA